MELVIKWRGLHRKVGVSPMRREDVTRVVACSVISLVNSHVYFICNRGKRIIKKKRKAFIKRFIAKVTESIW